MKTVLQNAKNFDTAHVAENYPYGFKLRTNMKEYFQDRFKIILEKTINGQRFTLELHELLDQDSYNEHDKTFLSAGFDYVISGPNWLSGYLQKQGFSEFEIFEYFEKVSMQDVSDAWEYRNEQSIINSFGN